MDTILGTPLDITIIALIAEYWESGQARTDYSETYDSIKVYSDTIGINGMQDLRVSYIMFNHETHFSDTGSGEGCSRKYIYAATGVYLTSVNKDITVDKMSDIGNSLYNYLTYSLTQE